MALPFLPGQVFDRKIGKNKFHKSQLFDYRNEVSSFVGEDKCGIGGDPLPGQKLRPRHSGYPKGIGGEAPAWVAFDRQVLCFDAYFQEAVHEKREEQYRIRRCKIYFYLEDDSIQVIEPKVENSGIPQGTLIRRHRIPLPPPNDEEFYTVENFNVGQEITLYSRTFKITGCDDFTHNFLRKLGVRIHNPENTPTDPYTDHRKKLVESMQPLRPYEKEDTLKQFLQFDRNVLRFFCVWDDSDNMFGDVREMELHYFLADDTVEICERIPNNCGRDAVPMFLRRQRLPKEPTSLRQPGEITGRTVLNVFGPMGHGGRWILDSLKTGAVYTDYYQDNDLTIGSVINVWGRKFRICDCDEFTKEYYKSKYGLQEFGSINFKANPEPLPPREIPPYNGFGSEEDSLATCLSLRPKPTRRDFKKFMEKDRHGLESNVLRFVARLDTTRPFDMDRRFIISYFLSDDTILVFEPPQRNSGILGGRFLERGRIKKPDDVNYFMAQDLYIGANVAFHKYEFILIDADEYAVNYMEKHAADFPQANVQFILPKLKRILEQKYEEIKTEFQQHDPDNMGKIPAGVFREILQKFGKSHLTVHEQLTVSRYFGAVKEEVDDLQILVVAVQEKLRKANFDDFSNMMDSCRHEDVLGTGFLPIQELHNICKRFNVPAKSDLLQAILERIERNDKNEGNYEHLLKLLNWRDFPVTTQKFDPAAAADPKSMQRVGPQEFVSLVSYKDLLQNLLEVD